MAMERITKVAVRAAVDFLGAVKIPGYVGWRVVPATGRFSIGAVEVTVNAFSKSSASSAVVEYRDSGLGWMHFATMASNATGHPEVAEGGVFTASGIDPVRSSWRMTPVEKMSARRST